MITRAGAPVYVDYAHTPDAIEAAIEALRPHAKGRLIIVFGAGGDRDVGKRAEMGAVGGAARRPGDRHRRQSAQRGSGRDPRATSWPARPARARSAAAARRSRAAIAEAGPGDIVLLAGKGHEQGQIVGDRVLPFDDVTVARECAGMSPLWTARRDRRRDRRRRPWRLRRRAASPSIRARSGPGDLFIAMKGEATDGHRFVDQAFAAGAAGALVSETVDAPARPRRRHDRGARTISAARRAARSAAQIIGVTGSVGKTGTKEALFAALDRVAPGRAHRSVKSYNNHTGVPLSPGADAARRRASACSRWA